MKPHHIYNIQGFVSRLRLLAVAGRGVRGVVGCCWGLGLGGERVPAQSIFGAPLEDQSPKHSQRARVAGVELIEPAKR